MRMRVRVRERVRERVRMRVRVRPCLPRGPRGVCAPSPLRRWGQSCLALAASGRNRQVEWWPLHSSDIIAQGSRAIATNEERTSVLGITEFRRAPGNGVQKPTSRTSNLAKRVASHPRLFTMSLDSTCANPLFLGWVQEWLDDARLKSSKGVTNYRRAVESLRACPIAFNHPSELLSVSLCRPGPNPTHQANQLWGSSMGSGLVFAVAWKRSCVSIAS